MLRQFLIVGLIGFSSMGIALAEDYRAAYKLYNEATAAGDVEAARKHAKSSWQAAETELGDHPTTAVLAYNYGFEMLFEDAEEAQKALARVTELLEAGTTEAPSVNFDLYVAYAAFRAAKKDEKKQSIRALGKRVRDDDKVDLSYSYERGRIALEVASLALYNEDFRDADALAEISIKNFKSAVPDRPRIIAGAQLIKAVAITIPEPRKIDALIEADTLLHEAGKAYPPVASLDALNPTAMTVHAWITAMTSVADDSQSRDRRRFAKNRDQLVRFNPINRGIEDEGVVCAVTWEKREPPSFPLGALRRGYIGSVIIGYHLSSEGEVIEPRVLAEVTQPQFGEVAMASVDDWKADVSDLPEACLRDQITSFAFVIK
ncbi:MAG: hypothetical protein AAFY84_14740 [Pseudomonadota bacterium]